MTSLPIVQRGLSLEAVQRKLSDARGRQYWRSLEELAATPEFFEMLHREFPRQASEWKPSLDRRDFLSLMAASLALAGLTGCTGQPEEKILPYVREPENQTPDKPLFFATATTLGGVGLGVLVESHMGRPTKIEGNPRHPGSLGATDVFAQASVLSLYNPDRAQVVGHLGEISTWDEFIKELRAALQVQARRNGAGFRILTGNITSPTLRSQHLAILEQYPDARWHSFEPVDRDNARAGARLAFGEDAHAVFRFDLADVVVSFDADFLSCHAENVRYARDFSDRRRVRADQTEMNRLFVIESTPSPTGASADHRLRLRAGQIEYFVRALAAELGALTEPAGSQPESSDAGPASDFDGNSEEHAAWVQAIASDLLAATGASIVMAGRNQPPVVHALVHAINERLENAGQTVLYVDPLEAQGAEDSPSSGESLSALVRDMRQGEVDLLLILGSNPVYSAPVDLEFAKQLSKVKLRVALSLSENETTELCQWHLPQAHELEAWGDTRGFDGAVTLMQPLIAPLYGGFSPHRLLSAILETNQSDFESVQEFWRADQGAEGFDRFWQTALHDGIVADSFFQPRSLTVDAARIQSALEERESDRADASDLEIIFQPDPTIWDGRFADNAWLQELPKPLTKLTWDNVAMLSPATAKAHQVAKGDLVELTYRGRKITAPVWVSEAGHPDGSVTLHLGYGRRKAGRIGSNVGFNAYALRTSAAPWFDRGLKLRKTGDQYPLSSTQMHFNMEGRDLVKVGDIDQFRESPDFVHQGLHGAQQEDYHGEEHSSAGRSGFADANAQGHATDHDTGGAHTHPSFYPAFKYDSYAWGMSIDLTACTGCNACVIACQAENNIPIVGKSGVAESREMHWLRIDTYFGGEPENPEVFQQPMLCMHCENAPCEVVCPVAATTHSSEGLNEMTYNRCVGTRYCSNNCPYKVRRFNFLQYADLSPAMQLLANPDVTVRTRGVMEKCTYCVQRINSARIDAKKIEARSGETHRIADGDIVTACQAACPTRAIVFGDVNDPQSQVTALKAQPHDYGLLTELNTRPRTTYLAKLRNPHPDLQRFSSSQRQEKVHPAEG